MSSPAPYHHGNLRTALVEAAVQAAREEGPDGLALRDLARRVGVSHNAAYRHFRDRDAVVAAVAARGMAALGQALQRGVAAVEADDPGDPVVRARACLRAIGRAYVGFALAEPGLFAVAFSAHPGLPGVGAGAGAGAAEDAPAEADPFVLLNVALDDLADVGYLSAARRPHAEIACWSAVHGFAVLCLDGPMRAMPPEERELALARMLALVDRSLGGDPVDGVG